MRSMFLLAGAGAFAMMLCGCAPELDQTGLSPEEKVWAENIKANYGAWQVPESVPRGVRRDDLVNTQNTSDATSATPVETVPAGGESAAVPAETVAPETPAVAPVAPAAADTAAAPVAPAAPEASSEVYTVAKGDTLGGIARKYYGKASAWKRIQDANKDVLKGNDKTRIYPGMKLQIPRP